MTYALIESWHETYIDPQNDPDSGYRICAIYESYDAAAEKAREMRDERIKKLRYEIENEESLVGPEGTSWVDHLMRSHSYTSDYTNETRGVAQYTLKRDYDDLDARYCFEVENLDDIDFVSQQQPGD
jgi:hypothetical protein